ncbi:cryptochrome/photolyase family protein [Lentisphaera marina]|uniref:cryptochrome/photolyase family protein n=1 Tax=Lentisphaera marina TaxID=1111041 RepID=UPI00236549B7|nr:cryptochrome/photolyase family protein [Lentisphaera marina]MDD7984860.1 cryptochrome/photolyase family protein [Lentisphaera marina]
MPKLCLILGDQLDLQISSLNKINKEHDWVVMMEIKNETNYVPHHCRKMLFLFSAMRHFNESLKEAGYQTIYIPLDAEDNHHCFVENMRIIVEEKNINSLIVCEAGEWRLQNEMTTWEETIEVPVTICEDQRFLISRDDFIQFAENRKSLLMEDFYHMMRKKLGYLMDDNKPLGGKWNYDKNNRSKYDSETPIPKRLNFAADQTTQEVYSLIKTHFPKRFGNMDHFNEACTRSHALQSLQHFVKHILPNFGKYQDAMLRNEHLMFHSRISHLINCGLLNPREVCEYAIAHFTISNQEDLNSIEAFIRQIIGWREYIRGIYWLKMPQYSESNYFETHNKLPDFYWTAKCKMNCVQKVVSDTHKYAYSHHIQRLMITGNLALLMGIEPKEVHEWYLAVYVDAYEWVELPNTYGMGIYADGGLLATKPYAASGNYINKMSDFCKSCHYNVKEKTGPNTCPFNYLYWDFLDRNKEKLSANHRLFMPYRNLEKMDEDKLAIIKQDAKKFINKHCS